MEVLKKKIAELLDEVNREISQSLVDMPLTDDRSRQAKWARYTKLNNTSSCLISALEALSK